MKKLIVVFVALLIAVATSVGVGAVDRDSTVTIQGQERLIPNRLFSSTFRFDPRTIRVHSGNTVTWVNTTDAPHTITIVADAPDDFAELFFCPSRGVSAAQPSTLTSPPPRRRSS